MKEYGRIFKENRIRIWALLFWLGLWQVLSVLIDDKIFLVGPVDVLKRLGLLIFEMSFWSSLLFSFSHILFGFFLALLLGLIFSYGSFKYKFFEDLIRPLILTIKSIPVASFIILLLIWMESRHLSIVIPQLIVLPIIYENILVSLKNIDKDLLEMALVFNLSTFKKIKYIYIPLTFTNLLSSIKSGVGLSFKSGIAAEVIGMPKNSIGENLQRSKVYLMTDDLFSWTIVIIILSLISERLLIWLFELIYVKIYGVDLWEK